MNTFSDYLDPDSDLAHYGVKGMKWGVRRQERKAAKAQKRKAKIEKQRSKRKTIADKYRPVGVDEKGRIKVHRRGALGVITKDKKLSKRKAQLLIDQMDMGISYKKAARDKYTKSRVAENVLNQMANYKYRDISG